MSRAIEMVIVAAGFALGGCWGSKSDVGEQSSALLGAPMITPSSGKPGDLVTIKGSNLGKVVTSVMFQRTIPSQLGGVAGGSLQKVDDDTLTVLVPDSALSGPLVGTIPIDTGNYDVHFPNFVVTSAGAPTITSLGTSGNNVRVFGTNFGGATKVEVGAVEITSFRTSSSTELNFTIPKLSGVVKVTNTVGSATSVDSLTYVLPPKVTALDPTTANEGQTVTLTGTDLDKVTKIRCDGLELPAVTQSATTITLSAPGNSYGCTLALDSTAGVASTPRLTVVPVNGPTAPSYTPTTAGPNEQLIVTGTNLKLVTLHEIAGVFGTGYASPDGTSYSINLPSTVSSGAIKLYWSGGSVTLTPALTVQPGVPWLQVYTVVPSKAKQGDTVTVYGKDFPDETLTVYFPTGSGGVTAVGTRVDSSTLTVTAPAFDGKGQLWVEGSTMSNGGGYVESIPAPPTLVSATPDSLAAGQSLTLTGTNLSRVQAVRVGGSWLSPGFCDFDSCWIEVQQALSGTVELEVVSPGGSATLSKTFTAAPQPVVSSFSPTTAKVGGTVTLSGTNLDQLTSIALVDHGFAKCGGTCDQTCLCVVNATTATFVAPSEEGSYPILYDSALGDQLTSQVLTVNDGVAPVVHYVSTTTLAQGGQGYIFGDHFSGLLRVELGGTIADYRLIANDLIRLSYNEGIKGGKVKVITVAGSVESDLVVSMAVPAVPPPFTITEVTPSLAALGSAITVKGTGLGSVLKVERSSGNQAGTVKVLSDTELEVTLSTYAADLYLSNGTARQRLAITLTAASAPSFLGLSSTTLRPGDRTSVFGANLPGLLTLTVGGQTWAKDIVASEQVYVPLDAISGTATITNQAGSGSAAGSITILPSLTAITVSPLVAAPGDKVVVSGTGVAELFRANSFSFPSASSLNWRALDEDHVELEVEGVCATGPFRIGYASSEEIRVTAAGAPVIDSWWRPDKFRDRRVGGRNFTGTRRVSIGGRSLPFVVVGDRELRIELEYGLPSAPLVIENAQGRTVSTLGLAAERPIVTGISTTTAAVGEVVTITGSNLGLAGGYSIAGRSDDNRMLRHLSDTEVSFLVDSGLPSGRLLIHPMDSWSDAIEVTPTFVVVSPSPPTVESPPTTGEAFEGGYIALRGAGFGGMQSIEVAGVPASSWLVLNSGYLAFKIPMGAGSGPIVVRNSVGEAVAGQFNAPDQTGPAATVTSLTPSRGVPGTSVIVEGTNLDRMVFLQVGNKKFSSALWGLSRAMVRVPLNLPSGEVVIGMIDGRLIHTGLQWTTLGQPALLSAEPDGAAAGDTITIKGDGFWGTTAVTIGGVAVAFTVLDNQTLEAVAPDEGASGTIVVTRDDGSVESYFVLSTEAVPDMAVPVDMAAATDAPIVGPDLASADDAGTAGVDLSGSPDMVAKGKDKGGCAVGGGGLDGSVPMLLLLALALRRPRRPAKVR